MKVLFLLSTSYIILSITLPRCHSFSTRAPQNPNDPQNKLFSPEWSRQEQYLHSVQKVSRRKAFVRLYDIARVLTGQILRPLVCSFAREPSLVGKDWDAFWMQTRGKFSNAERVALGLPVLGPTFVKLGQALATRPDILHLPLAQALSDLQDSIPPFDNLTAKLIIRRDLKAALRRAPEDSVVMNRLKDPDILKVFLGSLSEQPVAAASIAQVYKGYLPGFGTVAVKVQRPGIRKKVERDATLFHSVATWIERAKTDSLLGNLNIIQAVDEFTSRVLEDMDFEREVLNMQVFEELYDHRQRQGPLVGLIPPPNSIQVVVPQVFAELCSNRVIVMEWLEGTKLTDICQNCDDSQADLEENLSLVEKAIECNIAQLIDTGVLHADPHTGNLLKLKNNKGQVQLGYLDFGLVNEVPQRFRDGIVCAMVQIVFARNMEAVADLCLNTGLLSEEALEDPKERKRLLDALRTAFDNILIWPKDKRGRSTALPKVRFQNLLACLVIIITKFDFTVPPYFLNNVRALATLEGIALKLDPNFNILRVIYPYSINHLMRNQNVSTKAQETFLEICRNPDTKLVDLNHFMVLLNDWALLTGYRKRRIFWDLATSRGGRHVSTRIAQEWYLKRYRKLKRHLRHLIVTDTPQRYIYDRKI